ncbi:hypothetical protein FHT87_005898 [Rhizobium sp. BK316]|uniref:hypothetical protein n=1 Tax=Rhizobium sp. BK316 TaxID=2587053 RepID=UPI00160BFB63|nr:hypothetical protein [Rhizobium sp. BK316]MBB3411931.1 hypothetical protein [Rhizobium sp. BK316]
MIGNPKKETIRDLRVGIILIDGIDLYFARINGAASQLVRGVDQLAKLLGGISDEELKEHIKESLKNLRTLAEDGTSVTALFANQEFRGFEVASVVPGGETELIPDWDALVKYFSDTKAKLGH